ncbi:hypothetical protein O3M35_000512 [Rhynocoris fuscipes]|uniref:C2H2-type domain-containing protein n=1 Tax=Rhynocoris fuscipes TaxID=488301 RepID=A0AAW1DLS4_9HEMI
MKMNEEIDLNICDVLCSWNKLSSNDNSRKLVKVNVEDFPSGELENNSVLSEKIAEDISAGERKPLNNKAKTFTCSTCYKNLSSRNSLRIHLKIHSGDKNYCCEHCGKLFAHNATLIGHLTKFHNINVDTAHTCTLCNKIFCRKNALKIHMAIHVGFKPFSCSICSKSFSQKITRDIHALTHTGKYDYSCSDCPRKFSTLYKLNYHKKSHNLHEDYHLKNDSLSVCNQESENLPEYHCLLCLEQFTNKDDLDRHCDSHSSNLEKVNDEEHYKNSSFQSVKLTDPLGCIESGITDKNEKQVDGSGTLSLNNEVSASKKKFTCNFCGFIFPERRSLLHHIKMRHAVIPSVRHNCFICHKSFSQKSKLNFHMKRHTEVRDL